ncbi:ester cyclase [Williamsia sterculiae]|uniref:Predicted ester cyclase n=1 Tax=Williamsia sterculiae TaxID=1344003 RepID=A0A1N7G8W4_9NOCA|nr:ester cyclase [Williamsia sterculiae]SIS08974.1 Predicted ester cyclase [Williamsia sterculiae]
MLGDGTDCMKARYREYITTCNERRFSDLGDFVADDVVVADGPVGLSAYTQGLRDVVAGFPDYHWEIEDIIVEGSLISARLTDTGTHTGLFRGVEPTHQRVNVQELAMYTLADDKIVRCWGDLAAAVRDHLVATGATLRSLS